MIDLKTETLLTLAQARRHRLFAAAGENGNAPTFSTVWRWTQAGVNGAILETERLGARLMTSSEAMERFIVAQRTPGHAAPVATQRDVDRANDDAKRKLAAMGIKAR